MNASGDLPAVSANNIVDIIIYFGYFLSFVQFACLLLSNYKSWNGMFNSSVFILKKEEIKFDYDFGMPTFINET